jgi:hypothetical protein
VSLSLNGARVNINWSVGAGEGIDNLLFIFAEELFSIFNEANEDDDGGSRQSDEEHPGKEMNGKNGELHRHDCSSFHHEFAVFMCEIRRGP